MQTRIKRALTPLNETLTWRVTIGRRATPQRVELTSADGQWCYRRFVEEPRSPWRVEHIPTRTVYPDLHSTEYDAREWTVTADAHLEGLHTQHRPNCSLCQAAAPAINPHATVLGAGAAVH